MQNQTLGLGLFLQIVWALFTFVSLVGLFSLIAIAIKKLLPKLKIKLPLSSVGEIYLENKGTAIFFFSFLILSSAVSIFLFWGWEEEGFIEFVISSFLFILDNALYEKMRPEKNAKKIKLTTFDSEPE